jgi:hypothetical protein
VVAEVDQDEAPRRTTFKNNTVCEAFGERAPVASLAKEAV